MTTTQPETQLDVRALFECAAGDYCANNPGLRGDEAWLHVGDLTDCERAVWYRRKAQAGFLEHAPPNHDVATRNRFARGNGIEAQQCEFLRWQFERHGYYVTLQAQIAFRVRGEKITARVIDQDDVPDDDEILGHLDFLAVHEDDKRIAIGEVKSHLFLPDSSPFKHELQVSAYAYGVSITEPGYEVEAALLPVGSNGDQDVRHIDWQQHVPVIRERLLRYTRTTDPSAPIPPAEPPPEAYVAKKESRKKDAPIIIVNEYCDKYCPFTQCERYRENAAE